MNNEFTSFIFVYSNIENDLDIYDNDILKVNRYNSHTLQVYRGLISKFSYDDTYNGHKMPGISESAKIFRVTNGVESNVVIGNGVDVQNALSRISDGISKKITRDMYMSVYLMENVNKISSSTQASQPPSTNPGNNSIFNGNTSNTSGTAGSSGSSGATSSSGSSGSSGRDGIALASGSAGSSGVDGAAGSAGSSGADGADGAAGSAGSSGVDGAAGTSGSAGSSGVDGADGAAGSAGSSGAAGAAGTSGSAGSSGAAGTSGSAGSSGSRGTSGSRGSSGSSGANGAAGTSGSAGSSGANGANGTSGSAGSSGANGAAGTSGSAGSSGANGANGTSGSAGSSASTSTANTWTAAQRGSFTRLTDAATIAIDLSLNNLFDLTIGGSRTLGVPTNIVAGQSGVINVRQNSTGGWPLAFAWIYEFSLGVIFSISTGKFQLSQIPYIVNNYSQNTVTLTIATPCVLTLTAHGFVSGQKVQLTTTGSLSTTGLSPNVTYWINVVTANTFNLSTSLSNLQAGVYIATTGSQSGVHTVTCGSISLSLNPAIA